MLPSSIILNNLRVARWCRIQPQESVLDVGSGQHPFLRANVLVDRFLFDSSERAFRAQAVIDRPLFVADAERLPFADKSFDVVVCQHLLEHVTDPAALLTELQRVGKRGYIETPTRLYEKLYGNPFHAWWVTQSEGRLILEEKSRPFFDDEIATFFHENVDHGSRFGKCVSRSLSALGFHVEYLWENEIRWEIHRQSDALPGKTIAAQPAASPVPDEWRPPNRPLWPQMKSALSQGVRRSSDRVLNLPAKVRCPFDGSPLARGGSSWSCSRCSSEFPIRGNIHVFDRAHIAPQQSTQSA